MIIISIVNTIIIYYYVHVHVQCHFDDDEDDDGVDGGGCGRQLCSASHHTHFFERPLLDTSTTAPKLPCQKQPFTVLSPHFLLTTIASSLCTLLGA